MQTVFYRDLFNLVNGKMPVGLGPRLYPQYQVLAIEPSPLNLLEQDKLICWRWGCIIRTDIRRGWEPQEFSLVFDKSYNVSSQHYWLKSVN
jgi:hypothetical protein